MTGFWRRAGAMVLKEFLQLRRDRITFATMISIPLLQLVLFGIIMALKLSVWIALVTIVMVAAYVWFTFAITRWRIQYRREMNQSDQDANTKAVDSLLNYETVKYFGAEEREAKRYDEAIGAFARATVRNEVSLAWLNIGQAFLTNLMLAGAMIFTVWGWSRGR